MISTTTVISAGLQNFNNRGGHADSDPYPSKLDNDPTGDKAIEANQYDLILKRSRKVPSSVLKPESN